MAANRAVDDYAIKTCGIPGSQLMQQAGDACVEQMQKHGFLDHSPVVVILAGHGNNGGDGYVIAMGLRKKGIAVSVIMATNPERLSGDALFHYKRLKDMDVTVESWGGEANQQILISEADLIVDALLGTGIEGEIRAPYDTLIQVANRSSANVVAVDVPSGVTGDDGCVLEPCIHAKLTVSMGFGKRGCLFEPARTQSGNIVTVDIGFPPDSLEHIEAKVIEQNDIGDYPPTKFQRLNNTHKYSAGKVFIVAGSKGFTGAAILSSIAALRSGAGLVRLAIPESLGPIIESQSLETIVDYVPETADGGLALAAWPVIQSGCQWADTVVLGPGLGRHAETMELVNQLVSEVEQPLVIDADALFALGENPVGLISRQGPCILTPHAGEFKRLMGQKGDFVPSWQEAVEYAEKYRVSLLLKGAPSLIASPTGEVTVNSSGYAGMATAGCGDVLSGVIGSLWAQWPDEPEVLAFSMFIHGRAAELKRADKGVLGLIAGDIVDALPEALKEYGGIPF